VPGATLTERDLALNGPVVPETWLGAPALSYPNRPGNVLEVLDRAVRQWPQAPAFVDVDGTRLSYAEFAERVAGAAETLHARGVAAGDAVAVACRNRVDLAVAIFACAYRGAVLVGLNTRLAPAQWAYMLRHSGVRLALAEEALRAPLAAAVDAAELPSGLGEDLAVLRARRPWSMPVAPPAESSTYAVVYTSGTTGRPKASRVVHRCSVHSAMSYQKVLRLEPAERTAVFFPLYYISAMHAHVLPAMLAGATCVLVDTTSPRRYLELLAEHEVSWAYAVPSWWTLCARDPRLSRAELPALRRVAAGGAPMPAPLVDLLRRRLPGVALLDIYGLSETHSPATMLLDEDFAARPGSVGRALPCMEIEIRDPGGAVVPAGQAGEVWLRGSLVTTGYAGDPRASAESIVAGWFRTGDVGRVDDEGYLYILDRVKDMINRGGNKVFSAEVEAVLRVHPDVDDVAVVAVPDRLAGEAVAAVVVRRSAALTESGVRAWVREQMADYAAPSRVLFVDALPRNPVGKTDKLLLRAQLATPPT